MKPLVWSVAILAVLFGGWKFYEHRELARYGIDQDHPFGSFEKLDVLLTRDMKFQKDEAGPDAPPYEDLPEAAKSYRYMDVQSSGGFPDKVWLLVSGDGRLIAMTAWSRPSYTAVAVLMKNHWERIAGEAMELEKGQGEDAGPGWRGKWAWVKPGGFSVCFAIR